MEREFPPTIGVNARLAAAQIQIMFQHAVKIGVPIVMRAGTIYLGQ